MLLVIGASAQAETVSLDFNSLPSSQGWTYSGTLAENTTFAADGSSLVQTTLGTGSSSARYILINNGILDSSKTTTLSFTAQVLDHEFVTFGSTGLGFEFLIRDDVFQHRVGMTSSLLQVDNLFIALDTTTFHDYVFELSPGGGSKLFVDGILLASGEGFALGLSKLLLFGDNTIHENANVDITALSVTVGTPLELLIDIRPSKDPDRPNRLDPNSIDKKIKVAILSTNDFDALQVDQTTIGFGPLEAPPDPAKCKVKDFNEDGLSDLSCKFKISETGIACGDTEATLIGETFGGESISGTDSIETVGCT